MLTVSSCISRLTSAAIDHGIPRDALLNTFSCIPVANGIPKSYTRSANTNYTFVLFHLKTNEPRVALTKGLGTCSNTFSVFTNSISDRINACWMDTPMSEHELKVASAETFIDRKTRCFIVNQCVYTVPQPVADTTIGDTSFGYTAPLNIKSPKRA